MAMGHRDAAASATRGSRMTADHVGGSRRLVEEDQTFGIEVGLGVEPGEARLLYIGAFLLGRVDCPSLRVMPWRMKKRTRPLMLVWTPCSRNRSRNSRRNICGRASQVFKINAACASMRCEVRSPPIRLAAISPSRRSWACQRIAVATPTPKRAAACRHEVPANGADDAATKIEGKGSTHDGTPAGTPPRNQNRCTSATPPDSGRAETALIKLRYLVLIVLYIPALKPHLSAALSPPSASPCPFGDGDLGADILGCRWRRMSSSGRPRRASGKDGAVFVVR